MNLGTDLRKLWLSIRELHILSVMLATFSQEVHREINAAKHKDAFMQEFFKRFKFYLAELDYVNDSLGDLYENIKNVDISRVFIYVSCETHVPKKAVIIYSALSECSKNYEYYEISTITGILKEELDIVLREFEEKVMNKID